MSYHHFISKVFMTITLISSGWLSGCGQHIPKKHELLKEARAAYTQAQAHPHALDHAPTVLQEAAQTLKRAENAKDEDNLKQWAYIAQRQAQIAIALTEHKTAELEQATLLKEKEALLKDQDQSENTSSQNPIALKKQKTDKGWIFTLEDVLFESGKSDLLPDAISNIKKIASFLKQNLDYFAMIKGHTDSVGDEDYNKGLSQRRADEVRFILIEQGIPSNRIIAKGFGESRPIASNRVEAGRQKNRRVEILISREIDS